MRGLMIRGRWHPIQEVVDNYCCRRCGARIGKPWADPITGELDHERIVCSNEHEIKEEGDLIHANALVFREVRGMFNKIEVLRNYGHSVPVSPSLFIPEEFEGFD
jgi:hypothetical protein